MILCPTCQSYNLDSAQACAYCKTPLARPADPLDALRETLAEPAPPPAPTPAVALPPEPEPEPEPAPRSTPEVAPPTAPPPGRKPSQVTRMVLLAGLVAAGIIGLASYQGRLAEQRQDEEAQSLERARLAAQPPATPSLSPKPTATPHHGAAPKLPSAKLLPFAGSGISGYADGPSKEAKFQYPRAIAVDKAGNVYIGDSYNDCIRKIATDGTVNTFAKAGLSNVHGLAFNSRGTLYVADSGHNAIHVIASGGRMRTLQGFRPNAAALMGMAVDARDNVYVGVDRGPHQHSTVLRISPKGTFSEAIPKELEMRSVGGVAIDAHGALYVTDHSAGRIVRVGPEGKAAILAGPTELPQGEPNYAAPPTVPTDGWGHEATFRTPTGIAVDARGHLWVTDHGDRGLIRRITPDGYVKTVVDTAELTQGFAMAIGPGGKMYVVDEQGHRIYRLESR